MPETDAGLVEIARPTTWNGPGSLQTPVIPIKEEMDLPGFPTVIEPPRDDAEFSWITALLSVYVTVLLVSPGANVTLPDIVE
jgi:hypothetical protein